VTVREVQQGHRQFVTSDEARRALQRLTEKGMGRWETLASGSSGGRPSEAFVLRGSTDNDANS
jgi:predicted ArsR family transcriptional regulator